MVENTKMDYKTNVKISSPNEIKLIIIFEFFLDLKIN